LQPEPTMNMARPPISDRLEAYPTGPNAGGVQSY
jgi:hypothetical protein